MDWEHLIARVNWTMGQLVTALDLRRMGEIGVRNLLNVFGWSHGGFDLTTGEAQYTSGTGKALDFRVIAGGSGLDLDVNPGFGVALDTSVASPGDDFLADRYIPIHLDAVATVTPSTPGAYPRVDIVYIEPSITADVNDSRSIKSGGSISASLIDTRQVWLGQVMVYTGTAGTLNLPIGTPAGAHIELARIVHTGAGTYTIHDTREVLEVSETAKAPPLGCLTGNYCLNPNSFAGVKSDGLTLADNIPSVSMNMQLKPGIAVMGGRSYRVPWQVLTFAASDPADPRIDVVEVQKDGTANVVTGTPAAVPTAPSVTTDAMKIAEVYVAAAVTTLSTADVTDLREVNKMLTGAEFQSGGLLTGLALGTLTWDSARVHHVYVSALEWLPLDGGTNYNFTSTPHWVSCASGAYYYRIPTGAIPHGATVTEITVYYNRASGGTSDISLTVSEASRASGAAAGLAGDADAGGSAGDQALVASFSHTRDTNYLDAIVYLDVNGGGVNNLKAFGARITYTTTDLNSALGVL